MRQCDPQFEVCYFPMYYTHMTAQCRSEVDCHRIIVPFYWQSLIQASYAVLLQLLYLILLSKNVYIYLVVPRLFEEKWRDTVFGFPWGVVRGVWFRVFSRYFVPLTAPTVSVRSF